MMVQRPGAFDAAADLRVELTPQQRELLSAARVLYYGERRTGRSLVLALAAIEAAIRTPGLEVFVFDHHGTTRADEHLVDLISHLVDHANPGSAVAAHRWKFTKMSVRAERPPHAK